MKKVEIVGAGLAGLTAAINLAKNGYEVVVYEQERKTGGHPGVRPDPAGSPFDLTRLENFIGFDIAPAVRFIEGSSQMVWGKQYMLRPRAELPLYMVERGSRKTSLDNFLYEKAREAGVTVKFGHLLGSKEDFMELPPGSIIATGLEKLPYEALGIKHNQGYAYIANGKVDYDTATVTIYVGDYTIDYGFTSTINGISFGMLFQKDRPISRTDLESFDEDVRRAEDYTLGPWREMDSGTTPCKSFFTPRLFWENKILAGTLAGAIDPFMNFGMLGALLSGKIAAMAVEDRTKALKEFRRLNMLFNAELFSKKLWNISPAFARSSFSHLNAAIYNYLPVSVIDTIYKFVPGYRRMG